jgi:hypothetical protein
MNKTEVIGKFTERPEGTGRYRKYDALAAQVFQTIKNGKSVVVPRNTFKCPAGAAIRTSTKAFNMNVHCMKMPDGWYLWATKKKK